MKFALRSSGPANVGSILQPRRLLARPQGRQPVNRLRGSRRLPADGFASCDAARAEATPSYGLHPAIPGRADRRLRPAWAEAAAVPAAAIKSRAAPPVAPFAARPVAPVALKIAAAVA